MRNARKTLLALAAVSALALGACGDDAGSGPETEPVDPAEFPEGSTMARLVDEGSMTIGTKFQPLFGLQGPDGVPVGFDVAIGQMIADSLGVEAEFVEAQTPQRENLIENGTVDIVVATYTINDTRKEVVDFAGPYYIAGQSLMVLSDNDEINGVVDFDDILDRCAQALEDDVAFAAARQRTLAVRERRVTPARFRMPEQCQGLHDETCV